MKEMRLHLGAEGVVSNGNFLDRRPLTIDHIQLHTHPFSQAQA
jgi:hypothetical protein